ncbi:hypothetical protein MKX03_006663 [Papaver bracteatum]|nr:hypothetical protein MKX03_006663 [Papaver bracteatum]
MTIIYRTPLRSAVENIPTETNTIPIQIARDWLESTARGQTGREIDRQALQNLYSVHVQKGLIQDGNWRVGAIATLIDLIGASVVHTIHGNIHVSVDFNISFFSTVKVQEEVEIEAKVLGDKGSLFSFTVVIKKKENGDLVAIGTQWMSVYDLNHKSKM